MATPPSKDMQIGIHRGSIDVLAKETQELLRMVTITQQLMKFHVEELKKLGVDIEAEYRKAYDEQQKRQAQQPKSEPSDALADRLS